VRGALNTIRESLVLYGLGDAIYYCSTDGEAAVRRAVYGTVLAEIRPYEGDNVYLHVISHSLGATVAFDFLSCMVSLPLPPTGGAGVWTLLMIRIMEMNV
jgi:hypothetical protein